MFSMCSELSARAPIPDSRIAQFMQPWHQADKKATEATPSTEPVETPHPLYSSGNASDQPCKFKILQSPLESEKRRSVTRLPRDANLYSLLNLDGEGMEQEEQGERVEEEEEEEEEKGETVFGAEANVITEGVGSTGTGVLASKPAAALATTEATLGRKGRRQRKA